MANLTIGSFVIPIKKGDIWNIVLSDANFTLSSYIGYCDGSDAIINVIASPTVYSVLRGDINIYVNNKLVTCVPYPYSGTTNNSFGLSVNNLNLDCQIGGVVSAYSSSYWYVCDYSPKTLTINPLSGNSGETEITITNSSNDRLLNGYAAFCSNGLRETVRVIQDECDECENTLKVSTSHLVFTDTLKTINITVLSQPCDCSTHKEPVINFTKSGFSYVKKGNYYSITYSGTEPFDNEKIGEVDDGCTETPLFLFASYKLPNDECYNSSISIGDYQSAFTSNYETKQITVNVTPATNKWRISNSSDNLNCSKLGNTLYVSLKSYEEQESSVILVDKCGNYSSLTFGYSGASYTDEYQFYLDSNCDYLSPSSAMTALTSGGDKPDVYLLSTHLNEIYPWSVKSNDIKAKFTLYHGGKELGNRITAYIGGNKNKPLQFIYTEKVEDVGNDENKIYVVPDENSLKKLINGYTATIILQQDTTYNTVNIVYVLPKTEGTSKVTSIKAESVTVLSCSGGEIPKSSIKVYATTENKSPRGEIEEVEEEVTDFDITPPTYDKNISDSGSSVEVKVKYGNLEQTVSVSIGTGCCESSTSSSTRWDEDCKCIKTEITTDCQGKVIDTKETEVDASECQGTCGEEECTCSVSKIDGYLEWGDDPIPSDDFVFTSTIYDYINMNWTVGIMPNQTITSTKNGNPIGFVIAEQPTWTRIELKPDGVTFDLICDENDSEPREGNIILRQNESNLECIIHVKQLIVKP